MVTLSIYVVLFVFQIKLFSFHPVHQKQVEGKLEVHKDKTLLEATEIAWKVRATLNVYNINNCFLSLFDTFKHIMFACAK